jgi:hypothetical protein
MIDAWPTLRASLLGGRVKRLITYTEYSKKHIGLGIVIDTNFNDHFQELVYIGFIIGPFVFGIDILKKENKNYGKEEKSKKS